MEEYTCTHWCAKYVPSTCVPPTALYATPRAHVSRSNCFLILRQSLRTALFPFFCKRHDISTVWHLVCTGVQMAQDPCKSYAPKTTQWRHPGRLVLNARRAGFDLPHAQCGHGSAMDESDETVASATPGIRCVLSVSSSPLAPELVAWHDALNHGNIGERCLWHYDNVFSGRSLLPHSHPTLGHDLLFKRPVPSVGARLRKSLEEQQRRPWQLSAEMLRAAFKPSADPGNKSAVRECWLDIPLPWVDLCP